MDNVGLILFKEKGRNYYAFWRAQYYIVLKAKNAGIKWSLMCISSSALLQINVRFVNKQMENFFSRDVFVIEHGEKKSARIGCSRLSWGEGKDWTGKRTVDKSQHCES